MISTSEHLREVVAKALKTDAVAIDTEFVWNTTYYPKLGLIQLALSDEDCYLIDPLSIEDLSPFGELLADRRVIKIFHDAPQDLAILKNATGSIPKNIFDTRLAAGFAGLPATLSLGNLIAELLEIVLPKTETRTNWLQRPLDEEQVAYALDDVRYLRAVRILLINRIIGPEIKAWLQEELDLLDIPETYTGINDMQRFTKIRGANGLTAESLSILRELAAWRERTARKTNRPRNHVIPDATLLEISRKQPRTLDELQNQTTLSNKGLDRWGNTILTGVATGLSQPESKRPQPAKQIRLSKKNQDTLDQLEEFIQLKCKMQGIASSLIGNSSELKKLTKILNMSCPSQHIRQMEGWRKTFLSDFFQYAATL